MIDAALEDGHVAAKVEQFEILQREHWSRQMRSHSDAETPCVGNGTCDGTVVPQAPPLTGLGEGSQ